MDIHVRQARFSDVESLAQLLVLTLDDGSEYRYPHIQNYPDKMHALHCRWLYPTIRDPQVLIRVAIIRANGEDEVVGFSSWTNYETSSDSTDKKTPPAKMADWLPLVPETHDSPGTPASSRPSNALVTDKKRSEAFKKARARGELNHSHDVSRIEWNGLAIHPHYQGRGVATLVVRWGISKATKKGVPVFVTGEFAGVAF
ncbi:putative Acyl-n-acyltransferase [Seiridium unicorne]|uniref:Acyl-n-acyltransferase n=1 Tax=Seiridium unicorne TaxID=138068 RepID=A0ABR2VD41_9PEZI